MKKYLVTLSLFVSASCTHGKPDSLCQSNESLIFGFGLKSKKVLSVCEGDTAKAGYLVYRFGMPGKVELTFPDTLDSTSYAKFVFDSYLRGGGTQNEGLDENHLGFETNGARYQVYEEQSAREARQRIGIRVTVMKSKKEIDLPGIPASVRGTLRPLRHDERLKKLN